MASKYDNPPHLPDDRHAYNDGMTKGSNNYEKFDKKKFDGPFASPQHQKLTLGLIKSMMCNKTPGLVFFYPPGYSVRVFMCMMLIGDAELLTLVGLPANFPDGPPHFCFLTPTGVYALEGQICVAIGAYHANQAKLGLGIEKFMEQIKGTLLHAESLGGGINVLPYNREHSEWVMRHSQAFNQKYYPEEVRALRKFYCTSSPDNWRPKYSSSDKRDPPQPTNDPPHPMVVTELIELRRRWYPLCHDSAEDSTQRELEAWNKRETDVIIKEAIAERAATAIGMYEMLNMADFDDFPDEDDENANANTNDENTDPTTASGKPLNVEPDLPDDLDDDSDNLDD